LNPFGAFLFLQGLETLSLRGQRHSENALGLATYAIMFPVFYYGVSAYSDILAGSKSTQNRTRALPYTLLPRSLALSFSLAHSEVKTACHHDVMTLQRRRDVASPCPEPRHGTIFVPNPPTPSPFRPLSACCAVAAARRSSSLLPFAHPPPSCKPPSPSRHSPCPRVAIVSIQERLRNLQDCVRCAVVPACSPAQPSSSLYLPVFLHNHTRAIPY
jgi:hypothetical protein